jgi:hypothetical protein
MAETCVRSEQLFQLPPPPPKKSNGPPLSAEDILESSAGKIERFEKSRIGRPQSNLRNSCAWIFFSSRPLQYLFSYLNFSGQVCNDQNNIKLYTTSTVVGE